MDIRKRKQKKRDLIMIIALTIVVGGFLWFYQTNAYQGEASRAYVFYGNAAEPIVTIDFIQKEVTRHEDQDVPEEYEQGYPYIDEDANTITLLGDFKQNGVRQEVVIRYDFDRSTVQVIEETSPNNICSKEGESNGWPLICLPNRVRIEFEQSDEDFIV
ncbi:MAG: hypothetical protein ACLFTZ_02475 [Acholeplasmataceae bacterium]